MVVGKAAIGSFNLGRTKIRLEGLNHYASVSALLLNGALRIFTSTPKKLDERKHENFMKILFLISITATIILGGYNATVFSLLSLYSKTFLGMSMDDEYVQFFHDTEPIRKTAFWSFVGTILTFNISFVLSLYLQYEGSIRWWITGISSIIIALCCQNWLLIMKYASHIFEN